LDSKKNDVQCFPHKQQSYHLKNNEEPPTCLALEQQWGIAHRVVRVNCDSNRQSEEILWIKRVSHDDTQIVGDAFRLCHSKLYETACLSAFKSSESESYTVNVEAYLNRGDNVIRYQQWRQNPKTNQLVNVQTGTCLTKFNSKLHSNTLDGRLLAVGLQTCTRGANITMKQKWFFTPLPKC